MRVTTTKNGWAMEAIGELEWLFLERLPGTAQGDGLPIEKKARLLPDPIAGDALESTDQEEFLADWNDYVRPDLNLAFTDARRQVADDLTGVTDASQESAFADDDDYQDDDDDDDHDDESMEDDGGDEAGDAVNFRLEIPGDHSESWYSTLNQARLLMNEVYNLADSEERLYEAMVASELSAAENDEDEDEDDSAVPDGMLWMMLAQYQFYSFIQSFLIERVLRI